SIFVNSGSSANLLMVYGLLLQGKLKNSRIVVGSVSWVTTVSPIIQYGMEPILCDCDPNNLGLNVTHFEKLCKEQNPAAVILVHVLGHPNDMETICSICEKYNVILLEDCCESHGSIYNGKKVSNFGKCASFSFYFGHHMSTIEGGMVVTQDEELYNIMLSLRSHGWSRDIDSAAATKLKIKYQINDFKNKYTFYYPGFNLRSTDLNAFLGLEQLKRLDATINMRFKNYLRFKEKLEPYFWVQESKGDLISSFAFGLIVEDLNEIVEMLENNSIETRPLVCGSIGEQPFWIEKYGKTVLPNATRVHNNGLYISINQDLSNGDINRITEVLVNFRKIKSSKTF
ncbi:MAG TPA: DegT/DnrJ/EryC1/StrS family aminotransferase, partial [Sulfurimonas sp.]|nr:DegT/DnrJ/EryC1/StrS family aminotransferase [Sulfurimonas sp.]